MMMIAAKVQSSVTDIVFHPYYRSTFKKRALLSQSCWSSGTCSQHRWAPY